MGLLVDAHAAAAAPVVVVVRRHGTRRDSEALNHQHLDFRRSDDS